MFKTFCVIALSLLPFISSAQSIMASPPGVNEEGAIERQTDTLFIKVPPGLPVFSHVKLRHSFVDSVKYLQPDSLMLVVDPLEGIDNVGLRYIIRGVEHDYKDTSYVQDSLQNAVKTLLNYAKNDTIRQMVNYLKNYIDNRQTDDALRVVKRKIQQDSILSYHPDSLWRWSDTETPWREEALNMLYEYVQSDSVNLWLRKVSRDSIHLGVKNFMDDSLSLWVNNGKTNYKRFWLKKSRRDSIGIWIQNAPHKSIRILIDDDVYQESVQKTRKGGTRVKLKEVIPDENYNLAKIAKRERLHRIWKVGSIMGMGFTQGHLSNWAGGGESSVSTLTTINMFANYKKGNSQWDNTLDFRYGLLKTGDNGFRKNEDKFEINTKYGQKAVNKWFYSVMFNMKTQLFRGYAYPGDEKKLVSSFLAPGYFLFSVGMDYKPKAGLSVLLSPMTGKWTYVSDTTNIDQTKYGVKTDSKVKKETGAYVKFLYKWKITPEIILDNKLDMYSSYNNKPQNIDIDWQMNLFLRVNQYIETKISTHLISDDDTGTKVQFKENLTVGVSYRF